MNGSPTSTIGSPASAGVLGFDDHPCLSALASCSGLVPCEACHMALAIHCMPQALRAAALGMEQGAEPQAQVKAFFDALSETRKKLVADIRAAWIAHQARLEATRQALSEAVPPAAVIAPPRPSPASAGPAASTTPAPAEKPAKPAKRASSPPSGSQVVPIGRPKRSAQAAAAATETLDDIFKQAVTPVVQTPPSAASASPSHAPVQATPRSKEKKS